MSHPLYPEQNLSKIKWISLYEPKECMVCAKMCRDYEWKNITQSDLAGSTTDFIRVCLPCGTQQKHFGWSL